jgi:hypothetical protein
VRLAPLILLAGCADWPALEPIDGDGAIDPRLGVELARSTAGWRVGAIDDGDGVLVLAEERGLAWRAWRVRFPDEIEELAPPPFAIGELLFVGFGAVAAVRDEELAVFETGTWTALPPLPPPDALDTIHAHDGVVDVAAGDAYRWDGDAWTTLVADDRTWLGGADAERAWVLARAGAELRAIPFAADGTAGAPVALGAVELRGGALNGDGGAFQLIAGGRLHAITDGVLDPGTPLDAVLFASPGSPRALAADQGSAPTSTWTYVEGGVVGATALSPFDPALDGEPIDFVSMEPSPDGTTMALVMVADVDGHAVLTNRFLELPFPLDPFSP